MEKLSLMLTISIIVPLSIVCLVFDKKTRSNHIFLMIGILVCFFCGEFDGFLFELSGMTEREFTVEITPIMEELAKAYPLLIYAFTFSPGRKKLEESAVVIGYGFAILENVFVISQNAANLTIGLALIRGFGSGMMHAVSTLIVGYGISFCVLRRKLFFTGSLGTLCVSVALHSMYNQLVQSPYSIIGYILPILVFIPLYLLLKRNEARAFINSIKEKCSRKKVKE